MADERDRQLQQETCDAAKTDHLKLFDLLTDMSLSLHEAHRQFVEGAITACELQRHALNFTCIVNEIAVCEATIYEMEARLRGDSK